jgi:4-amino-4-deoxy-L-arabinose transferase-like glycosyltransferase
MKKWNQRKVFILFLTLWFLLNLLQAIFTEITSDEAYYGLYGKYLSWGYFDHPPMVALLTHLSAILFSGNLGIRFMTVLLQIGTLLFTWKLLDPKQLSKPKTINFFIIAASLVMFSAYGFITTPDVPLLFFTAFFLYAYQSFLKENSFSALILLTISMAGLVYSKYQAVLVIGFVVLSNLRLLTNYKFWLAGIMAIILLLPHFFWQFNNDFPSFKYHLVDRSSGFKWDYILEYLPNQLAVFNPFTFAAVIYVLYKYKAKSLFERAEYFLIIGFVGFFWLTALRGHVEPQWTVACSIPMIAILLNRSLENIKLNNYILKIIAPSLLLILIIRILLITPLLPERLGFSGKDAKYKAIEKIAGDKPVIFIWSFQDPSLYTFFTHKEAHVVSSLNSRQTQFDLWQFEQNYHNKPVFVCLHLDGKSKIYSDKDIQFEGFVCDSIQTTNRIIIKFEMSKKTVQIGDTISLLVSISNPTKYSVNFNHAQFPVALNAVFIN